MAIIVSTDPATLPTLEDLVSWTRGSLASYKRPTRFVVVDELLRNPVGTVLKHMLRSEYGGFGT